MTDILQYIDVDIPKIHYV